MSVKSAQHSLATLVALTALACSGPSSGSNSSSQSSPSSAEPGPAPAPLAAPAVQRVSGTSVSLAPPPGFVPASASFGFSHPERRSWITVTEFARPYAKLAAKFADPSALAERGLELRETQAQAQAEYPGTLIRVHDPAANMTRDTWMFGSESHTVTISAHCSASACATDLAALRAAVLSTRWEPELGVPTDDLPFRLDDHADLSVLSRMPEGLVLSAPVHRGEEGPAASLDFTVSSTPDFEPIADREALIREELPLLFGEALVIDAIEPLAQAGLEGLRALAHTEPDSGPPRFVYAVYLFEPDRHWVLVGLAPAELEDEARPRFEAIVAGFHRR